MMMVMTNGDTFIFHDWFHGVAEDRPGCLGFVTVMNVISATKNILVHVIYILDIYHAVLTDN